MPTPSTPVPPDRYTVQIKPRAADAAGHTDHGSTLRTAVVEATGRTGASGYPRYEGDGVAADIDPRSGAVEAITLDGAELPYGWIAETTPPPT
ncbi:hypothetical protein [Streptomyces albidochromogenes]|uniref:Uncharacterized protein n=1 Tax=Streptomyces albidochromogenes TaxID=329524 RepID=A0ABW6FUS4_9ACTN